MQKASFLLDPLQKFFITLQKRKMDGLRMPKRHSGHDEERGGNVGKVGRGPRTFARGLIQKVFVLKAFAFEEIFAHSHNERGQG